jgi:hypothetical protein
MKLIYSQTRHALAADAEFRNPRFFVEPEPEATAVGIVGDWPRIADAYRAAGVPVFEVDSPETSPATERPDAVPRGDVNIPDDWAELPWHERRALAQLLSDETLINGEQVTTAIEAELARRTFQGAEPEESQPS